MPNGAKGAVPGQSRWGPYGEDRMPLGALVGPLDVPITEENDAEGVTGCPRAPTPGDSVVSHVWSEHPRRRASHGREAGLTWSAIAIETNLGVRSRLDHATVSDAPCHMARRASSPSPRNRFRPRRPWRTPAVCWTRDVLSRRTRPSRSGGSPARMRNPSCGKDSHRP